MGNKLANLSEEEKKEMSVAVKAVADAFYDEQVQKHTMMNCILCNVEKDCATFVESNRVLMCPECAHRLEERNEAILRGQVKAKEE